MNMNDHGYVFERFEKPFEDGGEERLETMRVLRNEPSFFVIVYDKRLSTHDLVTQINRALQYKNEQKEWTSTEFDSQG